MIILLFFLFQDEPPAEDAKEPLSYEMLEKADQKLLEERKNLLEREQRLQLLLEEMKTDVTASEAREKAVLEQLAKIRKEWESLQTAIPEVPAELIAHYESRDPQIAAQDFMLLFDKDERVATALIKNMKKKKSAALMDQIARTGNNGKEIAAQISATIGSQQPNLP